MISEKFQHMKVTLFTYFFNSSVHYNIHHNHHDFSILSLKISIFLRLNLETLHLLPFSEKIKPNNCKFPKTKLSSHAINTWVWRLFFFFQMIKCSFQSLSFSAQIAFLFLFFSPLTLIDFWFFFLLKKKIQHLLKSFFLIYISPFNNGQLLQYLFWYVDHFIARFKLSFRLQFHSFSLKIYSNYSQITNTIEMMHILNLFKEESRTL